MTRHFAIRLVGLAAVTCGVLAMAAPPASASGCGATVVDGGGAAYVVVDSPSPDSGGVFVYAETDGSPGLQRDDPKCHEGGGDLAVIGYSY